MVSSSMPDSDTTFMKMALREAVKARGRTSPNPLVGAVIVKNGRVVGRGYHKKAGTPHAEVNAIRDAGDEARGATIYVTLEPCNHQGRTPPCTEAILRGGLARVVIGMADPNPQVAGGGSRYLEDRGLEVCVCSGILDAECRLINRPFVKLVTTGRPWVIMKAGLSLDGRIAAGNGRPGWISNDKSRRYTHRMRDQVDGILIGIGTALADNPSLTTRLPGPGHRDPLRIVLDVNLRLPAHARMLTLDSKAKTLVFCGPRAAQARIKALSRAGAIPITTPLDSTGRLDLNQVLQELPGRVGVLTG